MENRKRFNKVKEYYEKGLWTINMLQNIVGKKTGITQEEYKEIIASAKKN